uniref:exodeoxyribonuclease III n=1 Tax=Lygus hesperus TaxID=30085 RepID=A0A0A9X8P6_LYGHE
MQFPNDVREVFVEIPGFDSFWCSHRSRRGYSGVVTYARHGITKQAVEGFGVPKFDGEGRVMQTNHGSFILFNVYIPNGKRADRIEYKFKFIHDFAWKVRELADTGVPVVVVGDLNTSILDHDNFLPSAQCLTSCFLPEERLLLASITYIPQTLRDYLNKYRLVKKDVDVRRAHHHRRITLLQTRRRNAEKKSANSTQKLPPIPGWDDPIVVPVECGIYDKVGELPQPSLIDAFRYFYPNVLQAYTCWDTVRSFRRVNKGARIDVTLVSPALLQVEAHTIQQRYLSVPDTCGTDTAPTRR